MRQSVSVYWPMVMCMHLTNRMEPPTRSAIPVQVTDVEVDRRHPGGARINYEITLSCGCHWCEDRERADRAPVVGAVAYCATKHSRPKPF
jgi:hypothetical protein